jgi:transposase
MVTMRPIFVRKLSKKEKVELKKLLRSTNTRLYKRARVIWLSGVKHLKAPEIAEIADLHLINVRIWIKRFNQKGMNSLREKFSSGRPPVITPKKRGQIIALLKTKPKVFGLPWNNWTLRGLKEVVIKRKIVKRISHVYIGRIIAEEGYSYKRSKRWITSPDPEYDLKKTLLRKPLGIWTKVKK